MIDGGDFFAEPYSFKRTTFVAVGVDDSRTIRDVVFDCSEKNVLSYESVFGSFVRLLRVWTLVIGRV